jgi:S-adenosylmethionine hydrolase
LPCNKGTKEIVIVTFTDFGATGPYRAEMQAVLHRAAPQQDIVDLFVDAPAFNPKASAFLLAYYKQSPAFCSGDVFLCVVDPGVGTDRQPVVVRADGQWFVGPDNGLFEYIMRHAADVAAFQITWRPDKLSRTFHGRDLFAPVAAAIACGQYQGMPYQDMMQPCDHANDLVRPNWPNVLQEIIYIDSYGNLITGLPYAHIQQKDDVQIRFKGQLLPNGACFQDVPESTPLAYKNACDLVEISVNSGSAEVYFSAKVGDCFDVL